MPMLEYFHQQWIACWEDRGT